MINEISELIETLTKEQQEELAYEANKFYKKYFKKQLQSLTLKELVRFAEIKPSVDEIRGVLMGLQAIDDWFIGQLGVVNSLEEKNKDL